MDYFNTQEKQQKALQLALGTTAVTAGALTSQTVLAQTTTVDGDEVFTKLEGYATSATAVVGALMAIALGVIGFRYARKMFNKVS